MADPITLGALALTAAGTGISAYSTIAGSQAASKGLQFQAQAAEQAGQAAQQAKEFEAKQYGMQAKEARATAQRGALETRRQGRLLQSTLQARAAAGGGGATDPGVLNLAGDIAGRSEYQALLEMAQGENRARGLEDVATGARMTGAAELAKAQGAAAGLRYQDEAQKRAAKLSAIGTIVGGIGQGYNKLPSSRGYA